MDKTIRIMDQGPAVESQRRGGADPEKFKFPNLGIPRELPEILFLTSYPPRECGIATYSKDLVKALADKFGGSLKISVCPLEINGNQNDYPSDKYMKPKVKMDHLRKMTTDVGLIQFSKVDRPDIGSGYTVDDNARALIATCRHYVLTRDEIDVDHIRTYIKFIHRCIRCNGKFFNYVDKDCVFTDQNETENLEDAFGRALWAMGYFLSVADTLPTGLDYLIERSHDLFKDCLDRIDDIRSPRAVAFTIKGLYYYTTANGAICVDPYLREMADRLVGAYRSNATDEWQWFEKYLTYANAVLPEALLMAYIRTLDGTYRKISRRTFDFLLSKTFTGGSIRVISNEGWLNMWDTFDGRFRGGEQPIDVAYTILALKLFHKIFPLEGYGRKMNQAFNWFMGDNPMHETIYNPCTGGCYDGLEFDNVNLNQGAESTVCYLLARMAFDEEVAERRVNN